MPRHTTTAPAALTLVNLDPSFMIACLPFSFRAAHGTRSRLALGPTGPRAGTARPNGRVHSYIGLAPEFRYCFPGKTNLGWLPRRPLPTPAVAAERTPGTTATDREQMEACPEQPLNNEPLISGWLANRSACPSKMP